VTVGVAGLAALTAVFCKARALGQARRYRTMTGVIVISLTLGVAMAKALYDLLTANFSPQIGWLWPSLGAAGGMLIVAGWNLGRILRAWNPRGQSAPRTAPAPRSRREEIRQWVAAAGALLILTVVLWNPWEKLTVWMHDRMGGGWTGGQRIVGTMPNDPEELRTYLHHPDYRVRFSAAASIVVRHMVGYRDDLPKGPGYLVAHPPFTQADIDDAFQVLIETYARRDPTITGLQQYLGENLHRIFDRRMLKVFQMALTNEDFLEGGTSESFASGDALELLGKEENPNDGLWGRSLGEWIAQNYDRLKWNGGYFEVKAAPPSVTLGAVPAKL